MCPGRSVNSNFVHDNDNTNKVGVQAGSHLRPGDDAKSVIVIGSPAPAFEAGFGYIAGIVNVRSSEIVRHAKRVPTNLTVQSIG